MADVALQARCIQRFNEKGIKKQKIGEIGNLLI